MSDQSSSGREVTADRIVRPKVVNCDECANVKWKDLTMGQMMNCSGKWKEIASCLKGHTPRYIAPRDIHHDAPWGWRRACSDFTPNTSGVGPGPVAGTGTHKSVVGGEL